MKVIPVAFIGFGNVGKALADLFERKKDELAEQYDLKIKITGVFTKSHGAAVNLDGIQFQDLKQTENFNSLSTKSVADPFDLISSCQAEVLFENTPVNYQNGEPAVSYIRSALTKGMHVATANKGPVVHAYRELIELAKNHGVKFYHESTVMDGAPIFSLFREALPGARLQAFRGVLNSTTNMVLTRMENGDSFEQAIAYCQSIGIAETDPSGDIDGWDAAVKVAALITVLMDTPTKPEDVDRTGILGITAEMISQARREGLRWKLVCSARKTATGIEARVAPEAVGTESPFFGVSGTSSVVMFETDVLGLLSIVEENPGPHTTAYGLFADFLQVYRPR